MTIVAHSHPFVIGVDTHARTHTFAVVVAATGELVATEQFPTTGPGLDRAIDWAARRTNGDLATLWVIEGIATYGAHLASAVDRAGYDLVEAARMDARTRRGTGKSDPLDAHRIAGSVLSLEPEQLRRPRSGDGARAALRILLTAREHMSTERTATVNALTAKQIIEVSRWRTRVEDLATATARAEAIRLAKRAVDLAEDLTANRCR